MGLQNILFFLLQNFKYYQLDLMFELLNPCLIIILMSEISQMLQRGEELFLHFADQIEKNKISDISIRRALKKYDVKNLKINNVTPLRAKKMYATIIPKYESGITTDKSWLQNERRLFIWCTLCYLFKNSLEISTLKKQDFEFLKNMFPLKEIELIKFQIYSLVKKDNKNCGWKTEQDDLLRSLVDKQEHKNLEWSTISKQFFIQSQEQFFRNAKQCRQRWLNHLDPNKTKGKWETEQDKTLLTQVLEKGKKWSKIVEALDGKKNQHMIKNRYKSLIHKKQKTCKNKKLKQNDLIKLILKQYEQGTHQPQQINESIEQQDDLDEEFGNGQELDQISESQQDIVKNQQYIIKEEQKNLKHASFMTKNQKNWPIIVEPNNKKITAKQDNIEKIQEAERKMENQIQLCGSKADKEFVNSLFFNVNTPVPDDNNRIHSIILQTRSPAGNLFLSPFPAGCWTPTIFLVDDTQQASPQNILGGFSNTVKSTFHKFLADDNDKKN